ncbi:MAG TPA: DUF5818 domain-containing protein [Sphingomonas sp.]|uniref:DUF5818 domain-containing protein n=1 Tax=Sphingomonas sp. TaxID=28214 RepID=UPI002EDA10A5
MPRGTRHIESGVLRLTRLGYALELKGGGQWRLDIPGSTRRYIDQQVTVDGIRSGFDLLDVHRIWLGSSEDRPLTFWLRLSRIARNPSGN